MTSGDRIERIVLLGFMRSGKSSVGASLARRLGWRFVDFDVVIERREGMPVAKIIENRGEKYFRELEATVTREVARDRSVVLAPGGGWITEPAQLDAMRPNAFAVWLSVSPREIVRRLRRAPGDHPFGSYADPLERIAKMLAEREPLYRLADLTIPGDYRDVESIAFEIEQVVRGRASSLD